VKRLFVITALMAATASAQTHLTLHDALSRALQVNNTVERSRAEVQVQEENRRLMLSSVLPHVNATGSAIRNSEEVAFNSGGSNSTVVLPGNDWNYRIVLQQPIYAGNRERRAYEQTKLGVANAQQGVLGTEDAVLLRVASNYLGVVDADARIDIEKRNIELAQKRRAQAEAFYQAGEVTKVDILRAETSLKAAQRQMATAEQNRENAVSRLRADLDLDGDISVDRPNATTAALPDEQSLVSRAVSERPDVVVAQNNVKSAELEVRKQRGFWLPVVTFDAGYINQKSAFPASKYGYGAFRFTVPIWQSGEVEARVAQAKDREEQARLSLEDAKTTAREDVRQAVVDLRAAETSLQLAREQQSAAEAEYAETFERYRAQEATSLDVAASETSLADARRAVAEETLNRDLSQLRVWYAAGAFKDAVGVGAKQ
jgi:outer membrane protein